MNEWDFRKPMNQKLTFVCKKKSRGCKLIKWKNLIIISFPLYVKLPAFFTSFQEQKSVLAPFSPLFTVPY